MKKGLLFFGISLSYLFLAVFLMNPGLVGLTTFGSYPLTYKLQLLYDLLLGMYTSMSASSLIILVLTAILVGVNLTLVIARVLELKGQTGMRLVIGGGSLLGIAGSGCTACGLPVLSVFGLSGEALLLPFHGQELSLVALVMLFISLYLLLRSGYKKGICAVSERGS